MKEILDGLSLDLARGSLMRDGVPVHLRPLSYQVLKHLVENRGRLVGKEELIHHVWSGRAVTDGSIGKCIEEVRAALGPEGKACVRTVRGRGYIFDPVPAKDARVSHASWRTALVVAAASMALVLATFAGLGYVAAPSRASASSSLAEQYFQNGLFYQRKGGAENARRAVEYFERSVAADSRFARGWAAAAQANLDFAGHGFEQPRLRIDSARTAVEKALALDDSLAEAHATLGLIEQSDWRWSDAEREYKRAITLDPTLVMAHARYASYLANMGRSAEARAEIGRARELDPSSISLKAREGMLLGLMGEEEGIQLLRQSNATEPDLGHAALGFVYISAGRYDDAAAELREAISREGDSTSVRCYLVFALARSGRRAEAEAILSGLRTAAVYVSPVELGSAYMGLGDFQRAFELLETGYQAHDLQMQFLKIDRTYDAIRSEPRYQELMRRVGLPR